MRGQKRVEDARERAYDPRIHLLCKKVFTKCMDCTVTRACPSCAVVCAASRVNPTCGVKPGNDDLDLAPMRFRGGDNYADRATRSHASSFMCAVSRLILRSGRSPRLEGWGGRVPLMLRDAAHRSQAALRGSSA